MAASGLLAAAGVAEAAPHVVVSIKPLHSLVATVMQGVGEPDLIIQGAGSPHGYSLKPSDARAIESANVIFWAGPQLETFLEQPLETLSGKASVVALSDVPGLVKLPLREGGMFEPHHHDDGEEHEDHDHDHDHDHEGFDPHIWLDPVNAKLMAEAAADTLATADPQNAASYEKNAEALAARLDSLTSETEAELTPLAGKPFIVFHDAYQSFENRFGVRASGSITVNPETPPGARRIAEIRDKVGSLGAVCIFSEPQFPPALVATIAEGTGARTGILDPIGADLPPGPDLYFELIGHLASSLASCLRGD
nr:zinc ABC transporter substrate-binding protein [Consotaella salsifontis]